MEWEILLGLGVREKGKAEGDSGIKSPETKPCSFVLAEIHVHACSLGFSIPPMGSLMDQLRTSLKFQQNKKSHRFPNPQEPGEALEWQESAM